MVVNLTTASDVLMMSATFCPCAPIKEDTAKVGTWNWACISEMEVELLRLRVAHGDMCKPGSDGVGHGQRGHLHRVFLVLVRQGVPSHGVGGYLDRGPNGGCVGKPIVRADEVYRARLLVLTH